MFAAEPGILYIDGFDAELIGPLILSAEAGDVPVVGATIIFPLLAEAVNVAIVGQAATLLASAIDAGPGVIYIDGFNVSFIINEDTLLIHAGPGNIAIIGFPIMGEPFVSSSRKSAVPMAVFV